MAKAKFDDVFRGPPIPANDLRRAREALKNGDDVVEIGDAAIFMFDSRPYGFSISESRAMRLLLPFGFHLVERGWPVEEWNATELRYVEESVRTLRIAEMSESDFLSYGRHFGMDRMGLPLTAVRAWCLAAIEEGDRRRLAVREKYERDRVERLARRPRVVDSVAPESCAVEGCGRGRVFFDDEGNGYCKRHANERGLRPRGKIT